MSIESKSFNGKFGLEKESLRIKEDGSLAKTPHPFKDNKNIDRDFCENQVEIITDVHVSIDALYEQLAKLHNKVVKDMYYLDSGKEYLWQFSNPPYISGETDIPVAVFSEELKGKELYREYLATKYGKRKMLYSGIHFNFSLDEKVIRKEFAKRKEENIQQFQNEVYLNLAKQLTKYSWVIVYLTAASPILDKSFFSEREQGDFISRYASLRCSEKGYWNHFIPLLNYDNLDAYVESIRGYIKEGQLKSVAELYYPVRLKPLGENTLENLERSGVDHIEFRLIDLNPLSPVGINKEDIQFIHSFIIYLANQQDIQFDSFEQIVAIKNSKNAAILDDKNNDMEINWSDRKNIKEATLEILEQMKKFFAKHSGDYAMSSIAYQEEKLLSDNRYATQIVDRFGKNYTEKGIQLAEEYIEKM